LAFLERHGSNQHGGSSDFTVMICRPPGSGVIDARVIGLDRLVIALPQLVTITWDHGVEVYLLAKFGQVLLNGLQIA
jgi:hypothetical protein